MSEPRVFDPPLEVLPGEVLVVDELYVFDEDGDLRSDVAPRARLHVPGVDGEVVVVDVSDRIRR